MMRKRSQQNENNKRSGLTLIEAGLVLVLVGIVIGALFMVVPKLMASSKSDAAASQIQGIMTGIENDKASNGGAYRLAAAATAFSAVPQFVAEMGGANGMRDIVGWTYRCPAGAGQTITIVTTSFETAEVQAALINKVNGRMAPWAAIASGTNAITMTKPNVTCQ